MEKRFQNSLRPTSYPVIRVVALLSRRVGIDTRAARDLPTFTGKLSCLEVCLDEWPKFGLFKGQINTNIRMTERGLFVYCSERV